MIKAVLFDADKVLVRGERWSVDVERDHAIKIEPAFFHGVFQECLTGDKDLKKELAKPLKKWGWQGTVDEFLALWFSKGSPVDQNLLGYIIKLTEYRIDCYLATNQERYRAAYMANTMKLRTYFKAVFNSCDFGVKKDDPKYFKLVLARLKPLKPEQILLVDDAQKNLDSAASLGLQTFLYTDFSKFKLALDDLRLPPV